MSLIVGKSGYAAPSLNSINWSGLSIVLLATRWNTDIIDALVDGARRGLAAAGLTPDQVRELRVPGAFELPLGAAQLFERGHCDGVVTLGTIIRGDTPHFDFVAGECSRGLMDVQLKYRRPIGFGVLTVNEAQQAYDRAGSGDDNKGFEAASAMLEMLALSRSLA
jgi:6,7-dimethyl-8-ribityllumazine synthase